MHSHTFMAISEWTFEQPHDALTATERISLLALAPFVNAETLVAYPSSERLGEMTGLNQRTVMRALRDLSAPERAILSNEGQMDGFGNVVWTVTHPEITARIKGTPGSSIQLNTNTHVCKEQEIVDKKSYLEVDTHSDTSNGTSVDPGSRGQASEAPPWIQDTARAMSFALVDALIEAGLKKALFRRDAVSEDWLSVLEDLIGIHLGTLLPIPLDTAAEIFIRAGEIAPSHLDFSYASATNVPPKILAGGIKHVLPVAREQILPPSEDEDPRPSRFSPGPELLALNEAKRKELVREHERAEQQQREAVHTHRQAKARAAKASKQPATSASIPDDHDDFVAEIEEILSRHDPPQK